MSSKYTRYNTTTGKRAIYYFITWGIYTRLFYPADIQAEVVDIFHAFWKVDNNGIISSTDTYADLEKRFTGDVNSVKPLDSWNDNPPLPYYGIFGQYKKLKDSGKTINFTLSIGGWTLSNTFSNAVSTEEKRITFVNSIIDTFKKYDFFTGIDFDWEYLSNNGVNYGLEGNAVSTKDDTNFADFLIKLRKALKDNGMSHYAVTMCCTAAPEKMQYNIELLTPLLDSFNIMTYDFHDGNWGETKTALHTNPRKSSAGSYSCEEAADAYLKRGVPSSKIFIGSPFNSRGFSNTTGIGQPASGGSPDMSWEKGIVDYKKLPLPGATEYNDPESKGAYSYDPIKKVINTYDNPLSMREKIKIINEKNLGGIIIWEITADKYDDPQRSLIKLLYNELTGPDVKGPVPIQTTISPFTPSSITTTMTPLKDFGKTLETQTTTSSSPWTDLAKFLETPYPSTPTASTFIQSTPAPTITTTPIQTLIPTITTITTPGVSTFLPSIPLPTVESTLPSIPSIPIIELQESLPIQPPVQLSTTTLSPILNLQNLLESQEFIIGIVVLIILLIISSSSSFILLQKK
jgi:chitinase